MDYILLGAKIRKSRLKKSISQATLAERLGISVNYISYIENGKRHLSLELLDRIACELHTTVSSLTNSQQIKSTKQVVWELVSLLDGCTQDEVRIILGNAATLKDLLRENQCDVK